MTGIEDGVLPAETKFQRHLSLVEHLTTLPLSLFKTLISLKNVVGDVGFEPTTR